jgi:ectoine hydroxylase-related dioxygenase (phytanoyl-CoA dioxygenase family)
VILGAARRRVNGVAAFRHNDSFRMNSIGHISAARRKHWDRHGYLLIEQALSPAEVASLLAAVDAVLAAKPDGAFVSQGSAAAFKIIQAVSETDALDPLTDHPAVFPILLALLGPWLQILGSEIFVRTPGEGDEPLVTWHTDGGPTLGSFLPRRGNPVLQMKAQFFLTDLSESGSGNFMLVPGSHRTILPPDRIESREMPDGAIQLHARAGDVLLFPWSLWHAVAPNHSGRIRKSITFRYGQLWSRPYDYEHLAADVLARMTPRRRRLFGDLGPNADPVSYFYPNEEEHLRLMTDGL